ncbi:hypothetical protein ACFOY2_48795 [Nonomuraea purpurea]|uniref:HNH endonuclease n=1 Tax=Nonomuraea purpurea TaxID=1849276 RepID=A0ABV8GQH0_9ACTN
MIDEAIELPQVGECCTISGGRWYSFYDDVTIDWGSALDVDHMVSVPAARA